MDDSLYKREDDRKWRQRTDEKIVLLTTGEQVQNDRLDDLEEEYKAQDKILRGDPKEGLIEQLDDLQSQVRRINAILWPDAIGSGGLVNDVRRLLKQDDRISRAADNRWRFYTAVAVAIVSLIGLVLTNLGHIEPYLKKKLNGKASISSPKKPARKARPRPFKPAPPPPLEESDGETTPGEQ